MQFSERIKLFCGENDDSQKFILPAGYNALFILRRISSISVGL